MTHYLDGNSVRLLERGSEYFPRLLAALDNARYEIFLETYLFENDVVGRRVSAALIAAARRGVSVHLLVDGFGAREFAERRMPPLQAEGVQVLAYRRELGRFSLSRRRLRRMHRKLVVVDGQTAFVGGINIIDDLEADGPPHPRLDYAVEIEGPLLGPILTAAQRLWRLTSWANLRSGLHQRLRIGPRIAPAGDIRAALLIRDNLRHRHDIEDAYLEAIGSARSEIWIACAYFLPGHRFRQALVDAAGRGVTVRLILMGVVDYRLQFHATRALYPMLLGAGIRLFEYRHSFLHAKVAVVDDRWSTVGSSNIDPFSLLVAREANVVMDDENFARGLRQRLQVAIDEGSVELRPEKWSRLSWPRRALAWLAYQTVRMAVGLARVESNY